MTGAADLLQGDVAVRVTDLAKTYYLGEVEVPALRGVTFTIKHGDFVAIMGPSGSGKSTLMNLIGCLDQPSEGAYELDGVETSSLTDDQLAEIRNRKIGFVFQGFNLLPRMTALDQVMLPLLYAGADQRRERAYGALQTVGLTDRIHHRPTELSGGQQQRVAIARALVTNPALILADEPTGNLDSHSAADIMAVVKDLNERHNITVVLVTHEADIAKYARRIIRMRDGRIESDETVPDQMATSSSDAEKSTVAD